MYISWKIGFSIKISPEHLQTTFSFPSWKPIRCFAHFVFSIRYSTGIGITISTELPYLTCTCARQKFQTSYNWLIILSYAIARMHEIWSVAECDEFDCNHTEESRSRDTFCRNHKMLLNYYLYFLTFRLLNKLRCVGYRNEASLSLSLSHRHTNSNEPAPHDEYDWLINKQHAGCWLLPHSRLISSYSGSNLILFKFPVPEMRLSQSGEEGKNRWSTSSHTLLMLPSGYVVT